MKKIDDWYKREWKDADKILNLDREGLLLQIWKERSAKLRGILIGVLIGLVLGGGLL